MNEKKIYFGVIWCSLNFNKWPRIILAEEKLISSLIVSCVKKLPGVTKYS